MKKIFLLSFLLSLSFADFIKHSNSVIDRTRGLQWQDNIEVMINHGNWHQAQQYCKNLILDGFNDWRLPNKEELLTIVDARRFNPAIDIAFKYSNGLGYWTSTSYARNHYYGKAWNVNFMDGYLRYKDIIPKTYKRYVRCVRFSR